MNKLFLLPFSAKGINLDNDAVEAMIFLMLNLFSTSFFEL